MTSPADYEKDSNTLSLLAPKSNHIISKSADYARDGGDNDEKWVPAPRASIVGHKNALKISKTMKRKYLMNKETHPQFVEYMNDALGNGLNDKSGDVSYCVDCILFILCHTISYDIIYNVYYIDQKYCIQIIG